MLMPLRERMLDAETKAARYLADGNDAAERGDKATAKRFFDHAQKWHDKATKIREVLEAEA